MIEQITSLSESFAMRLQNPISKSIYKVDSINLIIGDNGAGKTKTIKSIIRELTEGSNLEQFSIEGDRKELGIVYYTAAPFHKRLAAINNKQVALIDASPPRAFVNGVAAAAKEYQKVAESLNIPNPLLSNRKYDFRDLAFRCARRLYNSYRSKYVNSQKMGELLEEHFRLSREKAKFSQLRKRIEDRQQDLLSDARGRTVSSVDSIFDETSLELRKLSEENECHALRLAELKERITDQFLTEFGPNNKKWAVIWMAACSYCDITPTLIVQVAKFLSTRDKDSQPKTQRWEGLLTTATKTLKILEATNTGTFEWSKDEATISADILKLLESKAGEKTFEDAHRVGLLAFGFDTVSSGEAAILNQITSITNSIHEIKKGGKNKILLFIDEGDILLHLSWQRRYLSLLDERLGYLKDSLELKSLQLVVATHSPLLASDVLRSSVTRMKTTGTLPSFGAPIQTIINLSFDTPSIGKIAEREILRLQNAECYSSSDLVLIEEIDDDFIRQYLKKSK